MVVGIVAHVDAGKTTLSESFLYLSGKTRKMGRVDNRDAFLDHFELERARGITIFSKQAMLELGDTHITLLDTPGHVDFSTEMERTLRVLDYAILVISGADGVQSHTRTLWRLLSIYRIPVFLFINKMDQEGSDRAIIMQELKKQLSEGCVDFGQEGSDSFYDQLAMCDEDMMEAYLKAGKVELPQLRGAIRNRKVFPCYFGAALKLDGIEAFMQGIVKYSEKPSYSDKFGAKIYKIERDEQGNRLTYMKITGGRLKVKDVLTNGVWEEKVNQIRLYSGQKFEAVNEVGAGTVCAVTGLTQAKPGEGLGNDKTFDSPVLEPVLSYRIVFPEDCDPRVMLPKLQQIEEEDPQLHILWDEQAREIQVRIMGEVQLEVLQSTIKSRFGVEVSFDSGRIVYKETIANTVEGVGHFEPLRHYAEVHLLLEPGERGSGLQFKVDCSDDILGKSWKNLILSHLKEKTHKGVLTGSAITDMTITLVSGRASNKHTQGGDFREATWRAVRQGLKQAESVLLEPYYSFELELPENMVGRAMTDLERMGGTCQVSNIADGTAVLTGRAPVATMKNYQMEVIAYTRGLGRLLCTSDGYDICHNAAEVIEAINYDSERDLANPTGSVFCANGVGFLVPWDEVREHMHVESYLQQRHEQTEQSQTAAGRDTKWKDDQWLEPEEVDRIFKRTFFANKNEKKVWRKRRPVVDNYLDQTAYNRKLREAKEVREAKEKYLLVDGYNMIFAWPDLKELAQDNMDSARTRLLDMLSKFQGIRKYKIIAVFDAYRVQRHHEEVFDYDNIHVVFTREAQTADQYIERFAHDNRNKYDITVATSDGLQQIIIRGAGSSLLSARELRQEMDRVNESVLKAYRDKKPSGRNVISDVLSEEAKQQMEDLRKDS